MNKLGHCASYSKILELKTSAAYTALSKKRLCPPGIIATDVLPSGLAWDNFDLRVEHCGKRTIGEDTIHDTVGIMYQSIPTDIDLIAIDRERESLEDNDSQHSSPAKVQNAKGRRKRSLEKKNLEELPHARQMRPRLSLDNDDNHSRCAIAMLSNLL